MFLSPGTAKAHLSHMFAQLGTPSRSHLAAEATKRKLNGDN
jgi:DNA-binding CsgD family transcriptional regulator